MKERIYSHPCRLLQSRLWTF